MKATQNYRKLSQGKHFNAYEVNETSKCKSEFLCNVNTEIIKIVKQGEIVQIDFDGDDCVIWNACITKKDKTNNRLYYSIL